MIKKIWTIIIRRRDSGATEIRWTRIVEDRATSLFSFYLYILFLAIRKSSINDYIVLQNIIFLSYTERTERGFINIYRKLIEIIKWETVVSISYNITAIMILCLKISQLTVPMHAYFYNTLLFFFFFLHKISKFNDQHTICNIIFYTMVYNSLYYIY